jgi:hypothetical protein
MQHQVYVGWKKGKRGTRRDANATFNAIAEYGRTQCARRRDAETGNGFVLR